MQTAAWGRYQSAPLVAGCSTTQWPHPLLCLLMLKSQWKIKCFWCLILLCSCQDIKRGRILSVSRHTFFATMGPLQREMIWQFFFCILFSKILNLLYVKILPTVVSLDLFSISAFPFFVSLFLCKTNWALKLIFFMDVSSQASINVLISDGFLLILIKPQMYWEIPLCCLLKNRADSGRLLTSL